MSEAAPAQDPATPDPLAYQRECGMADTMFTKLLTLMKEGSPDGTDAHITGAMTAIIRHLAEQAHQPQQTVTTRDVMASLTPIIAKVSPVVLQSLKGLDNPR